MLNRRTLDDVFATRKTFERQKETMCKYLLDRVKRHIIEGDRGELLRMMTDRAMPVVVREKFLRLAQM
jgi:hypothetical protein